MLHLKGNLKKDKWLMGNINGMMEENTRAKLKELK